MNLRAIGFWDDPDAAGRWPAVETFVDPAWDKLDREFIASYLRGGVLARGYAGWSTCRVCGRDNGDSEYSDGVFVWPSGFAHYVEEHQVRPPEEFVRHCFELSEQLFGERDETWWKTATPDW